MGSLRKLALPAGVRIFSIPGFKKIPNALEAAGCVLQSKRGGGADSTWQEIVNATRFIHTQTPLIFDVGANVGNWTSAMFREHPKSWGGRIVMFEPVQECWPVLEKLACPNVGLEKLGVSDHDGTLEFFYGDATEIASAYARSDFPGKTKKIEISCVSLDSYIRSNNIKYVDFIKMDVEGHEIKAISGAHTSLSQKQVGAISFEFGPSNVNSRTFFIDFFELFTTYKYTIYRLGHDGVPIRVSRYSRSLEYFNGVANYVASVVPPDRYRA
jgi:FkbM family methyltransferase